MIYDLNSCPLSEKNGQYLGMAGRKDGIVFQGANWIVKYPKNIEDLKGTGGASYSTAPLSEYLGSHVFEILGYEVHETILGERNGKLVVACKDFTDKGLLLEMRGIRNHADEEFADLLDAHPDDSETTHVVDLNLILLHLRNNPILKVIPGIEDWFWEQAIVDVWINNNDRNSGNWGILRKQGCPDRPAPIFDNGGSFQTKLSESKIVSLLSNQSIAVQSALNGRTAFGADGKFYYAKTFLALHDRYPDLKCAIIKVVPLIANHLSEVMHLIDDLPETHVTSCGKILDVCSANRKKLFKLQLETRYTELLLPAYNACSSDNTIKDSTLF